MDNIIIFLENNMQMLFDVIMGIIGIVGLYVSYISLKLALVIDTKVEKISEEEINKLFEKTDEEI